MLIQRGLAALARTEKVGGAMAYGPAVSLALVEQVAAEPALKTYHLLPSVRGDLLVKLDRHDEARTEFLRAADLAQNARERELLLVRANESPTAAKYA